MSTLITRIYERFPPVVGFAHDLPGPERWYAVLYVEDVPDTVSPGEVLDMLAAAREQLAKIAVNHRIDFQELEAEADDSWDWGWDWDE